VIVPCPPTPVRRTCKSSFAPPMACFGQTCAQRGSCTTRYSISGWRFAGSSCKTRCAATQAAGRPATDADLFVDFVGREALAVIRTQGWVAMTTAGPSHSTVP